MDATTATRTDRHGFPIKDCTRCHGTGHYSYCPRFGTRCFKCGGSKVQHATKKVAEAYSEFTAALRAATDTTPPRFEVGDEVTRRWNGARSGPAEDAIYQTVAAVEITDEPCAWMTIGDGPQEVTSYYTLVTWADGTTEKIGSMSFYRRGRTVDPAPFVAKATARAPRKPRAAA
jgi:hypothetical protein